MSKMIQILYVLSHIMTEEEFNRRIPMWRDHCNAYNDEKKKENTLNPLLRTTGIHELSEEECQMRLDIVEAQAIEIDIKLREARVNYRITGTYSNPLWYNKAYTGLKLRRRVIALLQRRIKDVRCEERESMNSRFVSIAMAMLDKAQFDAIMNAAKE
jgi:hypothetical protein